MATPEAPATGESSRPPGSNERDGRLMTTGKQLGELIVNSFHTAKSAGEVAVKSFFQIKGPPREFTTKPTWYSIDSVARP